LNPPEHGDVVDVDAAFDQQFQHFLDVAVGQAVAQVCQRTATMITSAGNRNPANLDRGGDQGETEQRGSPVKPAPIFRSANATDPSAP
jgi:hypothetical protein